VTSCYAILESTLTTTLQFNQGGGNTGLASRKQPNLNSSGIIANARDNQHKITQRYPASKNPQSVTNYAGN